VTTDLTTTSYATLGLLALQPWSTYELAQQMERSLRNFWPRAQSKIYEEPKKLVAHGFASAKKERTGRRPRTVYSITAKGRDALRRWLAHPGETAALEFEAILKVFFAEHGTKEQLLANIRSIYEQEMTRMEEGLRVIQEYLTDGGPFPERLHIIALMIGFLHGHYMNVIQWAERAEEEVDRWPGVRAADGPPVARVTFERAIKEMRRYVGRQRDDRRRGAAGADLGNRQRSVRSSATGGKRRGADHRKSQRPARRRNDVGVR
jgi:DNA-binding PadR family transcriptional regulator